MDFDVSVRGRNFIGGDAAEGGGAPFRGVDPTTGALLEPAFRAAGAQEVDRACALAEEAFPIYRDLALEARAGFLERIAANIEGVGEPLVERAMSETGLPRPRIEGERGRTCAQLRLFAAEVRRGDWLGVRIDSAQPDRQPLPRPDLRQRRIAVGPVAVFGASNFPLAFSVAGGDTAAALAAGCPVVVKGHPAHPGTSELVAGAVSAATKACGLPPGVFSMLIGPANDLGEALVRDPRIKAVGFTGSRRGGLALMRIANARPEPIPVFAEMSSINPVILLPGALASSGEGLSKAFAGSLTQNAGQFCTNPGLVLALESPELTRFVTSAAAEVAASIPQTMLTPAIHEAYESGIAALSDHPSVRERARSPAGPGPSQGRAALFETSASAFSADPALASEVFGPSSLIVRCPDEAAMIALIDGLEGQLTATIHFGSQDHALVRRLLPHLERLAGRVIANGWPTGVELGHAMVHGGPFPATSDGRSTSVGTTAIERFLRPVCYQGFPDELLPDALKNGNPLGAPRRSDG